MGYGSFGSYRVEVIDRNQNVKAVINDFISLSIIDIANGIGSWSLSSVTDYHPDFQQGDLIRVFRDGILIYGGVYTQLTEEYQHKYRAWTWRVSGVGLNQFLKWKLVYPALNTSVEKKLSNPYLKYNDTDCKTIIERIIAQNAVYDPDSLRVPPGFPQVKEARPIVNGFSGPETDVKLRFENLYDTVIRLANLGAITVIPLILDDGKVTFGMAQASDLDLSDKVVFDADLDQVISFAHTVRFPDTTDVVEAYNDENKQVRWFYGARDVLQAYDWVTKGQRYETFMTPRREDLDDPDGFGDVTEYYDQYAEEPSQTIPDSEMKRLFDKCAKADADALEVSTESYDVTINPLTSPYIYGYKFRQNGVALETDYWMGAKISVIVEGKQYVGTVSKMEISVSYGNETMKASIGGLVRGTFDGVLSNIRHLNRSVNRAGNTEGK